MRPRFRFVFITRFYLLLMGNISRIVVQKHGNSISCYKCNSHNDSSCMENPPDKFKVDCPGSNYILCRKIKQVIDFDVNGLKAETRIIRSCGSYNKSHTNQCYHRSGFGGRQEVCACQESYCNSSNALTIPSMLVVTLFAILKLSH